MNPDLDPRDLRPYGRRATDAPLRRPIDEDPSGLVDVMLYGKVCGAHLDAERAYFRALDRIGPGAELTSAVAAKNGKAEGLAEAVALLDGSDVVVVRARAAKALEGERDRNLAGVDRARAALRR